MEIVEEEIEKLRRKHGWGYACMGVYLKMLHLKYYMSAALEIERPDLYAALQEEYQNMVGYMEAASGRNERIREHGLN